jgi:hypothetical protein
MDVSPAWASQQGEPACLVKAEIGDNGLLVERFGVDREDGSK